jgi:hypothetical protein
MAQTRIARFCIANDLRVRFICNPPAADGALRTPDRNSITDGPQGHTQSEQKKEETTAGKCLSKNMQKAILQTVLRAYEL